MLHNLIIKILWAVGGVMKDQIDPVTFYVEECGDRMVGAFFMKALGTYFLVTVNELYEGDNEKLISRSNTVKHVSKKAYKAHLFAGLD